jgi:hypothetical protein
MNAPVIIKEAASLPALVRSAATKLAAAETSAEVLDARDEAKVAYDAAKVAGRMAKAKKAHDEIITAVYRAQADALEIESLAKRRLADEYDAAQDRGEVATAGGDKSKIPSQNFATVADIGLTHKDVHDARLIRDAEAADPGVTRRALDGMIERGEEPTKAALRREIAPPPKPRVSDDALWLWGRLRDFDSKGILSANPATLLIGMTPEMREDVRRLAPLVRGFMEDLEVSFVPA